MQNAEHATENDRPLSPSPSGRGVRGEGQTGTGDEVATSEGQTGLILREATRYAPNKTNYKIAPERVFKGTVNYPDEHRSVVRWLDRYLREKNLSLGTAAAQLRKPGKRNETYSPDSLYQTLTGVRAGGVDEICKAIAAFKEYVERESATVQSGFIHTSLYAAIDRICTKALRRHKVAFIFGNTQTGKSTNLQHFQREHNHGETVYTSMPAGGRLSDFLRVAAKTIFGSVRFNEPAQSLRMRIREAFDGRMLWIIDECHQAIRTDRASGNIDTFEFIREVYDASEHNGAGGPHANGKCGVVLCGTDLFRDEITSGRYAAVLNQLWKRKIGALPLPDAPTQNQLAAFAKAYGLPPIPNQKIEVKRRRAAGAVASTLVDNPKALQDHLLKLHGLGHWITLLQEAADLAADRKEPVTWAHLIVANAEIETAAAFEDTE